MGEVQQEEEDDVVSGSPTMTVVFVIILALAPVVWAFATVWASRRAYAGRRRGEPSHRGALSGGTFLGDRASTQPHPGGVEERGQEQAHQRERAARHPVSH